MRNTENAIWHERCSKLMMLPASAIDILSFSFASSDRRTVACSALDGHGAGGVDCCSMMYVVMCLTRRMMSASQPHIHTMGRQFLIPELKNLEEEPSKSNAQTASAAALGRMRYAENAIWHGRCSKPMMLFRNLRSHAEKAIWQEMQKMQFVSRDVANS